MLSEPLATCVPIPVGLPTVSAFTPSVQLIAVTLLLPVVVSSADTVPKTGECTYQPFCPSNAEKVTVTTGGLVSGVNTVSAAPVVVLLFACTLSVAVKLALIVWTANGVVGVTLTWQLTVPTGFAPCVKAQALMLSVLDGLLVEVTANVPTGFDAGPESVSVTVMVSVAAVPTGVLAVSGLMVVDVVRVVTVTLAEAVFPVPPLVEVTAAVVLFLAPEVVPFTFTEKVQEALAASVAPDRLTELEPATAVMVPPPQVPLRPFGVLTSKPAGSVSVKATPVSETVLAAGLVMVKLRLVVPFTGMEAAPNDLLMLGGATTDSVCCTEAVPADAVSVGVPPIVSL